MYADLEESDIRRRLARRRYITDIALGQNDADIDPRHKLREPPPSLSTIYRNYEIRDTAYNSLALTDSERLDQYISAEQNAEESTSSDSNNINEVYSPREGHRAENSDGQGHKTEWFQGLPHMSVPPPQVSPANNKFGPKQFGRQIASILLERKKTEKLGVQPKIPGKGHSPKQVDVPRSPAAMTELLTVAAQEELEEKVLANSARIGTAQDSQECKGTCWCDLCEEDLDSLEDLEAHLKLSTHTEMVKSIAIPWGKGPQKYTKQFPFFCKICRIS